MTPKTIPALCLVVALLAGCPSEEAVEDRQDTGQTEDAGADTSAAGDASDGADTSRDAADAAVAVDASDASDASDPPPCPGEEDPASGVVLTQDGALEGAEDDGVWSFRGVPFAAPPVGDLRWRAPRGHGCHAESPRPALSFGAKCPQPVFDAGEGEDEFVGDEDCLTLNVWTGSPGESQSPKPVLFFIHGGGNIVGSSSEEVGPDRALYDGARYARDHDVVVVTVQYRIGALGFLALEQMSDASEDAAPGTYGHLDQIFALEWVRDNISAFGGDPDQVMIFGESAGAINTCTLVASPLARGLFHGAIMQSGTCGSAPLEDKQIRGAAAAATIEECEGSSDLLACLRDIPALELTRAIPGAVGLASGTLSPERAVSYGPTSGTQLLPRPTLDIIRDGDHARVPFVIGSNAEEAASRAIFPLTARTDQQYTTLVRAYGRAFGPDAGDRILATYPVDDYDTPQDALIQVFTDASFTCAARHIARLASPHGDTFRYFFSRRPETRTGRLPARHGIELLHVFGTLSDIPLFSPSEADLALSGEMMTRWTGLANGDPNHPDGVAWSPYVTAQDNHLDFGDVTLASQDLRTAKCDLWDDLLGVD